MTPTPRSAGRHNCRGECCYNGAMATRHRILQLLQDGRFHSGETLGRRLGISRAAVWKALRSAAELGIRIDAVSGRGYRLAEPLDLLDHARIDGALTGESRDLLARLQLFEVLDSTNRYLMERAGGEAESGTVCLAEMQRAGRGRRGRRWVSPFGANLYLSALWRFGAGPQAVQGLSLAVGVAVAEALRDLGVAEALLKWPNDLLVGDAKLAGVLIEMAGEAGGPCHVVAGIGVNVRMPECLADAIDQDWTDLSRHCGSAPPSRNLLAGAILNRLLPCLAEFEATGFPPYLERWQRLDALSEQPVTVLSPAGELHGRGLGVDETGALRVRHRGGVSRFTAGEVSLRRAQ